MGPGKLVFTTLLVILVLAPRSWPAATFPPPEWAYPQTPREFKPDPDDGKPKHLIGSTRVYTYSQIEDSFGPADWYPNDHPRMPSVPVATGRKPDVRACSWCHLPNGVGHPQSANLTGLHADYMAQQLSDFKSGARHLSVGGSIMGIITRAMTPEETRAAIAYFTKLPRKQWVTVVETEMVPKTRIVEGNLRIPLEPEQLEPLGQRIVEVPKYPMRTRNYDSHAPFVAFVPRGAVKRGRTLVEMPGPKTPACVECHGQELRGLPHAPDSDIPTPPLAGRSPTYIVRQLYDIHSGARSGKTTELMKPIAAQLTLQQMIDAAAYLGSRTP
jgi:cytochrome c553